MEHIPEQKFESNKESFNSKLKRGLGMLLSVAAFSLATYKLNKWSESQSEKWIQNVESSERDKAMEKYQRTDEVRLLEKYQKESLKYSHEIDSFAPGAERLYDQREFEEDSSVINGVLSELEKEGKIGEKAILQKRTNSLLKDKKAIAEMRYFRDNDPRMIAALEKSCDAMNLNHDEKEKILKDKLSVDIAPINEDFFNDYDGTLKDGKVYLSSAALKDFLDKNSPTHVLGLEAVGNEFCHYIRSVQYGSFDGYMKAYNQAFDTKENPKHGYVEMNSLPEEIAQYYIRVMNLDETYTGARKNKGLFFAEKESFAVGAKTTLMIFEQGMRFRVNPANEKDFAEVLPNEK